MTTQEAVQTDENGMTAEDRLRESQIIEEGIVAAWQVVEATHLERGIGWYFWGSIAAIGMIVFAIFTQAWTLAVAIAVLAGVMFLLSQEPPYAQWVVITRLGIHMNKKFYPFSKIKSFWIVSEPDYSALGFLVGGKIARVMHIALGDQSPTEVREALSKHVREDTERGEKFLELLARKMKL